MLLCQSIGTLYKLYMCVCIIYYDIKCIDSIFILMMNTRFDIVSVEIFTHIQTSAIIIIILLLL